MEIKDILDQMKLKRTWIRVVELLRRGYYKNKEKRILFGAPIPPGDVLPLRIATWITVSMIFLVLLISASFYLHLFSILIKILLIVLLIIVMFLPDIIIHRLNKAEKRQ